MFRAMKLEILFLVVVLVSYIEAKKGSSRAANKEFRKCCVNQKSVPSGCYPICNYDKMDKNKVVMLFMRKKCPTTAVGQYLYCFGSGSDQRECCRKKNVHKTLAGDKCLDFCDLREGKLSKMDYAYWACWFTVKQITKCFKEHKRTLV